jgi:hypothetical protein
MEGREHLGGRFREIKGFERYLVANGIPERER